MVNAKLMKGNTHYDIIIIGTGAGGGTLAYHLAPSGKRVLILERGDYLPREKENWSASAVFSQGRYHAHETWHDRNGKPFHPGIHYYVGGNTKVYGAALLRFREKDFGELKHRDGISPAWPISYTDLAPYYTAAEKLYHVHGERGSDPTEPPCNDPYPYPPATHQPRIQALCDGWKKLGHKPFHLPLGLILDESNREKSHCIRCNTCDGFPCLVDAKADAHVACIRAAIAYPNVHLETNCFVQKLEASGKTVKKVITDKGTYSADIVVVSCGAINSAALLLRSNLANSSGCVGRHYMCHNNTAMIALSPKQNLTTFQKTLALNDFYFGSDDYEYPLGHIQMLGKSLPAMFKGDAPPLTPSFVLNQMARHALDFWLTTEDLPDKNNRVTLDQNGNIQLHYTENNLEPHKKLTQKLKHLIRQVEGNANIFLAKKIPIEGTAHQSGTLRFGKDPSSSVLDPFCKAHDLDNLYVVDGSFFVSSTSVNPALTIIANALRVGDHLIERMQ